MNQNDEKLNRLMEAMGEIDPRYVEEARQAIAPESEKKHTCSPASLLSFLCRWTHSSAARLAVTACLILLVVYGVQKIGMLSSFRGGSAGGADSNLFHSGSENSNLQTNWSEEKETISPENNGVSGSGDTAGEKGIADNKTSGHTSDSNRADSSEQKEEEQSEVLTKPPLLTLHVSDETFHLDPNTEAADSIDIQSSDYVWSYGKKEGSNASSLGQGTDLWNLSNLPLVSLNSGNELIPDFNSVEPDSFSIRCIPASEVQKADRETYYQTLFLQKDGSFQLPEGEDTYIVEIHATWDNNTYEGDCTYRFQAALQK